MRFLCNIFVHRRILVFLALFIVAPRLKKLTFLRGCQDLLSVYRTAKLEIPAHFRPGDHSVSRQLTQLGTKDGELVTIGKELDLVGTKLEERTEKEQNIL